MTFVIAKIIDREASQVMLLADTKLTHRTDERLTKNSLVNPLQKVVIVSNDIVVGFAGDNPEQAIRTLVQLRGNSDTEVESRLLAYTREKLQVKEVSTSFLMAVRRPTPRIVEISNGAVDDRTTIGTGWIGDRDAFRAYTKTYLDLEGMEDRGGRFVGAMASVVTQEEIDSVGGHMVRASGSSDEPIRFRSDPGFVMPWNMEARLFRQLPYQSTLQLRLPNGGDPTRNTRIPVPGTWLTYSALAHYIPELRTGWLHTHEQPWQDPIRIVASSTTELAAIARSEHQQLLNASGIDAVIQRNLAYPAIRLLHEP